MSLISKRRGAWLLLGLALLWAQTDHVPAQVGVKTPGPGDIPEPIVGDVGLAGDPRPDIARFLNVRSVESSSLSPDGQKLAFVTRTTGMDVGTIWIGASLSRSAIDDWFREMFSNGLGKRIMFGSRCGGPTPSEWR
jgi:hypothetical protein